MGFRRKQVCKNKIGNLEQSRPLQHPRIFTYITAPGLTDHSSIHFQFPNGCRIEAVTPLKICVLALWRSRSVKPETAAATCTAVHSPGIYNFLEKFFKIDFFTGFPVYGLSWVGYTFSCIQAVNQIVWRGKEMNKEFTIVNATRNSLRYLLNLLRKLSFNLY